MIFHQNQSIFMEHNFYVEKNGFLNKEPEQAPLPIYEQVRENLPKPFWDNHDSVIRCYEKAWQIAFSNLCQPVPESNMVSNYIDSAFNDFLFMWDSSFIVMFGKYASRFFDFQKTLDNFYSKQHQDGFICREIAETQEGEQWSPFDPSATGPNILAWSEWEYFMITGNKGRLSEVFDPLMGFHLWMYRNRTWSDGSYWANGLSSGMDNQPRTMPGYDNILSKGHQIWCDTCIQQLLNGKILLKMANILGRQEEMDWIQEEVENLTKIVNEKLWDEKTAYYYDLWKNGQQNQVKSIGAYWALLADVVDELKIARFVKHLENPDEFCRLHRIPSLSADHEQYQPYGDYWKGGVWAPTNYMVLKGLEKHGYDRLCYEIAWNHVNNVVEVFEKTGTLHENYAPEYQEPGRPAKEDFVGWTGLSAISILLEYVFGIRPDSENKKIIWHINLEEKHGVHQYPFGDTTVDLECEPAKSTGEFPIIRVCSDETITVEVHYKGKIKKIIT